MLATARLHLRNIRQSDLELVHLLHSLPESDRFNTLGIPKNIDATKKIVQDWISDNEKAPRENYFLAVELKPGLRFIGLAALKLNAAKYQSAEVWYKLYPTAWGQGYATEAVRRLIDFGCDDLKLHRIEAGCAVDNIASVRVLEKAGMHREGKKRQALPLKSGWSDCYEFGILSTDKRIV